MGEVYKEKPIAKLIMLKGADGTGTKLSEFQNDMTFLTEQEIITLVTNIVDSGTVGDIDTGFVTTVKEQNHNRGLKFWVGTKAEYDALLEHDTYTYYIITDDPYSAIEAMLEALKTELEGEIQTAVAGVNYDDQIAALTDLINNNASNISDLFEAYRLLQFEVNDLSDAKRQSFYVLNEVATMSYSGGGYLTGSSKTVRFSMPLSKLMPTSMTIDTTDHNSTIQLIIRQNGHYILGSAGNPFLIYMDGTPVYPDVVNRVTSQVLTIQGVAYLNVELTFLNVLKWEGTNTEATNNSEFAVNCVMTFKVKSST